MALYSVSVCSQATTGNLCVYTGWNVRLLISVKQCASYYHYTTVHDVAWSTAKFEGDCNTLIVLVNSVYVTARMLKSDASSRKTQIQIGYCKTTIQRIPFSWLHSANTRSKERTKYITRYCTRRSAPWRISSYNLKLHKQTFKLYMIHK